MPHRIVPGKAPVRYRLAVAARILAATAGGYGVSALAATALALWLPATRLEAALTGTLASFIVWVVAVLWVFAADTAARAWLGLGMLALPIAVLMWMRLSGAAA